MANIDTSDLHFVKARASMGNGACVEVAALPDGGRVVRDTKNRDGGVQVYTRAEWAAFVDGVKAGEFDV